MGATTFSTYAQGKNAKEAFQKAVAIGKEEHGSYGGSIGAKKSFVTITVPKGMDAGDYADYILNKDTHEVCDKWGPAGCILMDSQISMKQEKVEIAASKTKTTNMPQKGTKKWVTYYVLYCEGTELDKQTLKKEALNSAKTLSLIHQKQIDIRIEKRLEEGNALVATVSPIFPKETYKDVKEEWNTYLFFGWVNE